MNTTDITSTYVNGTPIVCHITLHLYDLKETDRIILKAL